MKLKELNELLNKELNERRETITAIKTEEPDELPNNWKEAHSPIPPFKNNWGRGVLFRKGNEYFAKIGGYGTSHSNLKSGVNMNVEKTFYFGLDDKTLYIMPGSIGTTGFSTPELKEIVASIGEQGPLKGSIYRLGGR
jgi:hypothetical protein